MPTTATDEPVEYRQIKYKPPAGAADLTIIRHGESAPSREDRPFPMFEGQADPELDPVGVAQAERLAARLAGETFAAIYVTPLQRTHQTAAPLAARLGLTPVIVSDLRETHFGEWEGPLFRKRIAERAAEAEAAGMDSWEIPGAEKPEHFRERIVKGITQVALAHPDERVAVVVHGGVIGMVMSIATGVEGMTFASADNASVSQLVVLGDKWTVRRYNDTAHLETNYPEHPTRT